MGAPGTARPLIQLNCAVSVDGRLAYAGGARARLSGPEDLERVQALRADSDAILVGVGTVLADDPTLRVHWELLGRPPAREPMRIVLDSHGRTPTVARVLDGSQPTLVATSAGSERAFPPHVLRFAAGKDEVELPALLAHLNGTGVRSLLVEGGARVLASFLRSQLFDRMTVYVAPVVIGGSTAPPMVAGRETEGPDRAIRLRLESSERLGDGLLVRYARTRPT